MNRLVAAIWAALDSLASGDVAEAEAILLSAVEDGVSAQYEIPLALHEQLDVLEQDASEATS